MSIMSASVLVLRRGVFEVPFAARLTFRGFAFFLFAIISLPERVEVWARLILLILYVKTEETISA